MMLFTFDLAKRFGLFDKLLTFASFAINKYLMPKSPINGKFVAEVFDAVDGFWLKYGKDRWYSESQLRVIVGAIAESLRDNQLSPSEVKTLTDYVLIKWNPEIATRKPVQLPSVVEDVVDAVIAVFDQLEPGKVNIPVFVKDAVGFVMSGKKTILNSLKR